MIASIRFGPIPTPTAAAPATGPRRGDERIRAVVEVEQRPLRALEQDEAPVAQGAVDEQRRVDDIRPQPLREPLVARRQLLELERLGAVDALEPDVLLGQRDLDLLAQDLRVEQVLHADPEPRRLVRVGGADPALGRPDLQLAEAPLAALVDRDVPGMIRCASPETRTQPVETPRPSSSSSSRTKTSGSITHPAPRTHSLPCRIPEGMWWNLNFSPPVTIVCPAFGPPW
jgi:hypothetical protein